MELLAFIGMCLIGAFCVIGLIEWIKSLKDGIVCYRKQKYISAVVWPVCSLFFSAGMGFSLGKMPNSTIFSSNYNAIIFASILMLSFNELLGYNVIMKLVFHLVDKVIYGNQIPEQVPESVTEKIKAVSQEVKAALKDEPSTSVPIEKHPAETGNQDMKMQGTA
jgi:hypothetical protein